MEPHEIAKSAREITRENTALLREVVESRRTSLPKFIRGDTVRKIKGSEWHGTIVGEYKSSLTEEGYAVESWTEKGSVQIYPANALDFWKPEGVFNNG